MWVMCVEVIQIVGYVCEGDTDCVLCVCVEVIQIVLCVWR